MAVPTTASIRATLTRAHSLTVPTWRPLRKTWSRQLASRLGKSNDLELMRRYLGANLSETDIRRVQRAQAALQKKIYVIGPKLFRHEPDEVRRSLQRRCAQRE